MRLVPDGGQLQGGRQSPPPPTRPSAPFSPAMVAADTIRCKPPSTCNYIPPVGPACRLAGPAR